MSGAISGCGRARLLVIVATILVGPLAARAQAVPAPLQAAIFHKVLKYDSALAGVDSLAVVIVGREATAEQLAASFRKLGVKATTVNLADLAGALEGTAALYLGDAKVAQLAGALAKEAKILTLSGDSDLARGGLVSVALGISGGKTEIIVNMKRLAEEGHKLSADLLALASVIK